MNPCSRLPVSVNIEGAVHAAMKLLSYVSSHPTYSPSFCQAEIHWHIQWTLANLHSLVQGVHNEYKKEE